MHLNKNQNGFIPMLICIVIVLGAVVWFAYKHVNDAHKNKVLNTVQQNENIINR